MEWVINPQHVCATRVTELGLSVCVCVCACVCYYVFRHYAQQDCQKATPTGSADHWLDFKMDNFRKSTAFKTYGVKQEWKSQYEYCLTSTHLCRCTLWKHQKLLRSNVSQRLHSNATYEYSYPVGLRNYRLWAHCCGLDTCVYIAVACNLVDVLRVHAEGLHFSAVHSMLLFAGVFWDVLALDSHLVSRASRIFKNVC